MFQTPAAQLVSSNFFSQLLSQRCASLCCSLYLNVFVLCVILVVFCANGLLLNMFSSTIIYIPKFPKIIKFRLFKNYFCLLLLNLTSGSWVAQQQNIHLIISRLRGWYQNNSTTVRESKIDLASSPIRMILTSHRCSATLWHSTSSSLKRCSGFMCLQACVSLHPAQLISITV